MLNQVILNVLLHNPDAHLKNYALLYQEDGYAQVSPMHDSLYTHDLKFRDDGSGWGKGGDFPLAHTRELSMQIGDSRHIDQVTIKDWENMAIECGFTSAFVRRRVKELSQTLYCQNPTDIKQQFKPALEQIHHETSLKTRFNRFAQAVEALFSAGVWSVSSGDWVFLHLPRLAGVTSARYLLLGANTPWKRVRLTLGLGLASNSEKSMLESSAFQVLVKLFGDMCR